MTAPTWFEDEPDVAPRSRRRRSLGLALVLTAWIVVAAILARGSAPAEPTPAAHPAGAEDHPGPSSPPPDPTPSDTPDDVPPHGSGGTPSGDGAGAHGPAGSTGAGAAPTSAAPPTLVGRDEAVALTLAVVRAWLSDGGPDLDIPGIDVDRRAYLEHVAVEDIEVPGDDLAVARALVVLLVRDEDRYTEAVVRRAAVPLTITSTSVHPGGPPWWLPGAPDLSPIPPPTTPFDDPRIQREVATVLEAAGYRDVDVGALAATRDGGTVVADVRARTPAGDEVDGPLWLRATAQGYALLGEAPRGPRTTGEDAAGAQAPEEHDAGDPDG